MTYLEKAMSKLLNGDEKIVIANYCPDEYFGLPHKCPEPNKLNKDCILCWNREMPEVKNE